MAVQEECQFGHMVPFHLQAVRHITRSTLCDTMAAYTRNFGQMHQQLHPTCQNLGHVHESNPLGSLVTMCSQGVSR